MVSRNLNRYARIALVLLLTFGVTVLAYADNDYAEVKREISSLKAKLPALEKASNQADQKLAENLKKQKSAKGDALKNLKSEAITLSGRAAKEADALRDQQQKIANKQAELREKAADQAVDRLNGKGALSERIADAIVAMDDWRGALGTLPKLPEVRDTSAVVDPDVADTIKKDDRKRLTDFDKWAEAEEKRIKEELKQARDVEGANNIGEDKQAKELLRVAGELKEALQAREKSVKSLRKNAKSALAKLK